MEEVLISQSLRSQVMRCTDTIGQLRAELEEKSNAVLTLQRQRQSVADELDEKSNEITALQSVLTQRDADNRCLVDQIDQELLLERVSPTLSLLCTNMIIFL